MNRELEAELFFLLISLLDINNEREKMINIETLTFL